MGNSWPLMHTIAGRDQVLLILIHELGPALQHDDDMEVGDMAMPSGTLLGRLLRPSQLGDDATAGCLCDPEVAIFEKGPQPVADPGRVTGFDVGECIYNWLVEHVRGSPLMGPRYGAGSRHGRLSMITPGGTSEACESCDQTTRMITPGVTSEACESCDQATGLLSGFSSRCEIGIQRQPLALQVA